MSAPSPLSPPSPPASGHAQQLHLREIEAPYGWTAAILAMDFPAVARLQPHYAAIITELLARIPAFERSTSAELFLQFDRCAPDREIPILQQNARSWQPEFGLGVWLDQEPPTLWSKEEFLAAAPGTLRPVINRAVRLEPDPAVQADAWQRLLGSGVLVRVATPRPGAFLQGATEYLQQRITEPSLSSFPFYLPLLTAAALRKPQWIYEGGLDTWLPEADGYIRESAEDGGLLVLARQRPETFWPPLAVKPFGMVPARLEPPTSTKP